MKVITNIRKAIIRGSIYLYCKIVYRAKITGTENIPRNGAILLCANHKSFLDPPLIESTCKRPDVRFLAKKELAKNRFFAHLGNLFGEILDKHRLIPNFTAYTNSNDNKLISKNYQYITKQ